MKKTTIEVSSNLTPFHQKLMLGMLSIMLKALEDNWKEKSKKTLSVTIDGKSIPNFRKENELL